MYSSLLLWWLLGSPYVLILVAMVVGRAVQKMDDSGTQKLMFKRCS